jgi:hypothetical protein
MLFCRHYYSPLNTFMRKVEEPDPDPDPDVDPYLCLMDPDPGGLKTCGSCGSGSPTLDLTVVKLMGQCTEINTDLLNPETRGPGK